jgi:hypothetical protein
MRPGPLPPAARRWEDPWALAVALAFGILSSVSRPFVANQNTYLVHAARISGRFDELATDWFANTTDPTPVFSTVAAVILRLAGPFGLVVANAAMGTCFLHALTIAAEKAVAPGNARAPRPLVAALLAAVWFSMPRVRPIVFDGVAEQYVHQEFFQPASFGVLLVAAFASFAAARATRGLILMAAAVWFHPTYAFSFFALALAVVLTSPGSLVLRAARVAVAAASVLPPLIYTWIQFIPTSPEHRTAAQSVLVEWRLPHHAIPERWFDETVVLRMFLVAATLLVCRRVVRAQLSIILAVMLMGTLLALAFPGAQSLRLLFPWRISAWLTPISFAVLVHRCLSAVYVRSPRTVTWVTVVVAGWALAGGAVNGVERMKQPASARVELAKTLRSRRTSGPIGTVLIPTEWEDIRLNAKLPVFVDFKSHPFRDVQSFYAASPTERCSRLSELLKRDRSIEWILSPPEFTFECGSARKIIESRAGKIHQVMPRQDATSA